MSEIAYYTNGYLGNLLSGEGAADERLCDVFKAAVTPHLLEEADGDPFYKPERHEDRLLHILDWLSAAFTNKAAWTEEFVRRDPKKIPRRLKTFQSLYEVEAAADSDMREANRALDALYAGYDDRDAVEIVKEWTDGFTMVLLKTPQALRREGALMGHCIGNGAYDEKLAAEDRVYYSLRDAKNNPHVTLEIKHVTLELKYDHLLQCKGKGNEPPVIRYFRYLRDFAQVKALSVSPSLPSVGMVFWEGGYHSIFDLPKNIVFEGELDLSSIKSPIVFPKGTKITGDKLIINGAGAVDYTHCAVPEVEIRYSDVDGMPHRDEAPAIIRFRKKTGHPSYEGWFQHGRPHRPHTQGPAQSHWDDAGKPRMLAWAEKGKTLGLRIKTPISGGWMNTAPAGAKVILSPSYIAGAAHGPSHSPSPG